MATENGKSLEDIDSMEIGGPIRSDVRDFVEAMLKESDRGCVLIGAAYLDDALEEMLRTNFSGDENVVKKVVSPLFKGGNAPLGTFSVKTNISFALGLINNETFKALNNIRKVRNEFAHKAGPVVLTDQRVSVITSKLEKYLQEISSALLGAVEDILEENKTDNNKTGFNPKYPFLNIEKVGFSLAVGMIGSEINKGKRRAE